MVARVKWWAQEFERQFKGPSNCQAWIKCGRRMGGAGPRMTPCWVGSWMTVFVSRGGGTAVACRVGGSNTVEKYMYRRV